MGEYVVYVLVKLISEDPKRLEPILPAFLEQFVSTGGLAQHDQFLTVLIPGLLGMEKETCSGIVAANFIRFWSRPQGPKISDDFRTEHAGDIEQRLRQVSRELSPHSVRAVETKSIRENWDKSEIDAWHRVSGARPSP